MAVTTSKIMNIKLKILVIESRITLTVVVNTRSQQYRLTITKLELVLVTRFVVNKVVVVEVEVW